MRLIDHPSLAGLKHVSATSGGEWAGPCPWCGGKDRFRVWPDHPSGATGGRFMCRGCGRQGDGIQFLRDLDGLSYPDACKRLGVPPRETKRTPPRQEEIWAPKPSVLPGVKWSGAAGWFVGLCAKTLLSCKEGMEYALSRGLSPETIASRKIGWNRKEKFADRASWGLPEEINPDTGRPRKVWSPAGLVIPTFRDGQVVAIKIRRSDWKAGDKYPKYVAVSGGGTLPMILPPGKGKPCVVVESEIDAILIAQEAGDLVTAIALGTAKAKPEAEAHAMLTVAPVILVATDYDKAGADAWPWWREHYAKAKRWPVPHGKDVGDLMAEQGMVRAWIEAGLPDPERSANVGPMQPPEHPSLAGKSPVSRAATLAHGEPCPYSPDQLAAYAVSHPSLVCCPTTTPPWGWKYKTACLGCETPCQKEI